MADETTAEVLPQDGPTEENAEESTVAKAETAGTEEPQATANEADSEQDEQRGKRLGGWQRKIQKLERELGHWRELALDSRERKADESEAKPAGADLKAPVKPNSADFSDWDKYQQARDQYSEDIAEYKVKVLLAQDRAEREKQTVQQQIATGFGQQCAEARKQLKDFDTVAFSEEVALSQPMQDAIVTSDYGALIAYELGKNPDEAERIARLSPMAAAREIGKIEARIIQEKSQEHEEEVKPAPASRAPKPPAPVRKPSTTQALDPDNPADAEKMTAEEWAKAREKKLSAKR